MEVPILFLRAWGFSDINARSSLGNHAISIAHRIAKTQPRSIAHLFAVNRDQDRGTQPARISDCEEHAALEGPKTKNNQSDEKVTQK